MAADEDRFRPRLSARQSGKASRRRFVSQVLRAAGKAGAGRHPLLARRPQAARLARGHVAAKLLGTPIRAPARRVVVKVRLVVLAQAGVRSMATHLAYIQRDAVGPDAEPGQAYGRDTDMMDTADFEERGSGDRHQFRIIVAPEDGAAIGDLKPYTRELMARMEADLGTRLEWVAVDHHDTGHPHTHIVLRGVDDKERDLVIARDYISHGMRHRACETAELWLGPRTQREIQASVEREVTADRWTGLDQAILRTSEADGRIEVSQVASGPHRTLFNRRLGHLEQLGLAEREENSTWRLSARFESTLRTLSERDDIIRSMQRALGEQHRELAIPGAGEQPMEIAGRIVGKGLADEFGDRLYVVVDGVDGRAHYLRLPQGADPADWPIGGIISSRPGQGKAVDQAIAAAAKQGVYDVAERRAEIAPGGGSDAERTIATHVRRLEALRRAGIVERISEGLWRVPSNFVEAARAHDQARGADIVLRSRLELRTQVRAIGATWLDQTLIEGQAGLAHTGFGAEVRDAVRQRGSALIDEGLARRSGQRLLLARNLLGQLRARDLEAAAQSIAAETGLTYRAAHEGKISGTYVRAVDRPSGRFAMLDDGAGGFALLPWRPVIDNRLGQSISGIVRGTDVSWDLAGTRGIGR